MLSSLGKGSSGSAGQPLPAASPHAGACRTAGLRPRGASMTRQSSNALARMGCEPSGSGRNAARYTHQASNGAANASTPTWLYHGALA
jgi:hypothetical protein